MKFEYKRLRIGTYDTFDGWGKTLIRIGHIWLANQSHAKESYCFQFEDAFNYYGIRNALCGKINTEFHDGKCFTPKRILVIQLK